MRIKIHTKGIKGSGLVKEGEEPTALFGAVLEVDGMLIEEAFKVEVKFEEGFVTVTPHLYPGTFEIVSHTEESWPEMLQRMESERAQRSARTGMGQALARASE